MPAVVIGGIAIAGLVTQTVAQIKAGNAAKRAGEAQRAVAESQADLADYNAQVAALQAQDALDRGTTEEYKFRSAVDVMVGAQRAAIAGHNIDVNFGSAVDVQADAAYLGELDALMIRTNAAREAWGFRVESQDYRERARIARQEGVYLERAGREAQSASRYAAAGTIIGGSVSLLEARYGFSAGGTGRAEIPALQSRTYAGTYRSTGGFL